MKKMLAVLFAALLLMAGFASAEEVEPTVYFTENWAYILLEDGTAEIVGHNSGATTLIVPGEIDGHMVTRIGVDTFNHCTSMTSITLPDSLCSIGAPDFTRCTKLTDIIVSPDHPTLATINGVLFEKSEKRLVCYPRASAANSYTVPQGIRIIGDYAFYGCDSLTSITLPNSIISIGDDAFYECSSLTNINLPDSITAIGDDAFYKCSPLTSINLPDSITAIGESTFFACSSLTSITLPDSIASIGARAFCRCKALTSITLPASITSIGDEAFSSCRSLTLTIPRDSWLVQWCKDNNLRYTYPDSLDWLLE